MKKTRNSSEKSMTRSSEKRDEKENTVSKKNMKLKLKNKTKRIVRIELTFYLESKKSTIDLYPQAYQNHKTNENCNPPNSRRRDTGTKNGAIIGLG